LTNDPLAISSFVATNMAVRAEIEKQAVHGR
jgi:hypothetical protein